MTDTIRTREELEAVFPTGIRGGVTAQALRDLLASVPLTSELSGLSGYSGFSGAGGGGGGGGGSSDSGYSGYSGYSGFPGGDSGYSGFSGGYASVHNISAKGTDQTTELNAVYQACGDTDTIFLTPGYDSNNVYHNTFYVTSTLQWTGKNVNVFARGITIESSGGSFPVVIYGAAVGTRNNGCLHWDGGALEGGMIVQNVSYSRICPDNIYGTFEIRTDTVSAYNNYEIVSIDGNPCLLINLINNGTNQNQAWANKNRFCKTELFPTGGGVAIATSNPAPHWYPGQWIFDDCDFEAGNATMFNCESQFYAMFLNGYWEGNWSLGTLNINPTSGQCTLIVNGEAGVPAWAEDPRFLIIGGTSGVGTSGFSGYSGSGGGGVSGGTLSSLNVGQAAYLEGGITDFITYNNGTSGWGGITGYFQAGEGFSALFPGGYSLGYNGTNWRITGGSSEANLVIGPTNPNDPIGVYTVSNIPLTDYTNGSALSQEKFPNTGRFILIWSWQVHNQWNFVDSSNNGWRLIASGGTNPQNPTTGTWTDAGNGYNLTVFVLTAGSDSYTFNITSLTAVDPTNSNLPLNAASLGNVFAWEGKPLMSGSATLSWQPAFAIDQYGYLSGAIGDGSIATNGVTFYNGEGSVVLGGQDAALGVSGYMDFDVSDNGMEIFATQQGYETYLDLCDGSTAIYAESIDQHSNYREIRLADVYDGEALYASDNTNEVYICDGDNAITAHGIVQSYSGFKFPDGSVQTSAAAVTVCTVNTNFSGSQTWQTFANTNVTGLYRINYYLVTTTIDAIATVATIGLSYSDLGGARSPILTNTLSLSSDTGGAVNFVQGTCIAQVADTNGIRYAPQGTDGNSAAYQFYATVEKLQ